MATSQKIAVLGTGLVGKEMALDLSDHFSVSAYDINEQSLAKNFVGSKVRWEQADLSQFETLKKVTADADLVVGALPGWMGFGVLKQLIELKKNVVDICFFPEDALELNTLAVKNNVTCLVDIGLAPGISNLTLGFHQARMQSIDTFECMVGGLPRVRKFPYEYKAVFSPIDVIEEYTRPARYVENGFTVTRPALTDIEMHDFPEVGTLESFNTDGLRSLIQTCKASNMKEKTLRYPGHARFMEMLRAGGFFDKTPTAIKGTELSPLEMTAKIMFPKWQMTEEDQDITVMKIKIDGKNQQGQNESHLYTLVDHFDTKRKVTSMARTTGYTATAAVHLLLNGKIAKKGVLPPELIGDDEKTVQFIFDHLKERGVNYTYTHQNKQVKNS